MAKAKLETEIKITLEIDENEAKYLKGILQNFIKRGELNQTESAEDNICRETIYIAIDTVLRRG